jgi:hypothetical protein
MLLKSKNLNIGLGIFTLVLVVFFIFFAINKVNDSNSENNLNQEMEDESEEIIIETDLEVTNLIKEEAGVFFAQVTYHPQIVFAAITIESDVSKERAEEIGTKYMSELTQKYPSLERSVQIINREGTKIFGLREE